MFRTISVLVLALASCTALVKHERVQCGSDQECQERGGAFVGSVCRDWICEPDPRWSCLGVRAAPAAEEGPPATLTIRVRELRGPAGVSRVNARVCNKLDLECNQPRSEIVGEDDGTLRLPVFVGFDGFVDLSAAGKLPGRYYVYPPVHGDREVPYLPMIGPLELAQFAAVNGLTIDPGRGHLFVGAYDCQGRPAAGVRLWSDYLSPETETFYLINSLPTKLATATDATGRGGFLNLQAGTFLFTGMTPDGRQIAQVSLIVRERVLTYATLAPPSS